MYDTDEHKTKADLDIENRLVIIKRTEDGRRKDWEFGISRCKPLYVGWINHNGKEYITESLYCIAEIKHNTVNHLHFNKILKTEDLEQSLLLNDIGFKK